MGTVGLVDAALPHLLAGGAGSIVTISSVSGREIDFASGLYGTMKAAIIHYTQGVAFKLAGKGVRANTVSPGNTYFPGGVWPSIEENDPELFATALGAQPDRPDGDAAGGRQRGGVPEQFGGQLHHRHQPAWSTAR